MVSCWVPYLTKGTKPDFNNDTGDDLNSCRILSSFYSSLTRIKAPPRAIPSLWQMEYTSVQVSYLCFSGSCQIWPRAAGMTSIMAKKVTQIVAACVYSSPARIMDHPKAISILNCKHELA